MWKCSKCEAMVEDNEKICPACGEPFESEEAEAIAETEEAAEAAPEAVVTEEITEETAEEAVVAEEITEETAEENVVAEEITEEAAPEDEEYEEVGEEISEGEEFEDVVTFDEPLTWICATCGAECDGESCPYCGQEKPEDVNYVDFVPKKNNKIYMFVAAVAVVVALTVGIFAYYFINRNVDRTGENGTVTYADIESATDGILGSETMLKINGVEVSKVVFESYLTNNGLYYQQDFCYNELGQFDETKLDSFKWTDIADDGSGETHLQKVLTETVNNCVEIYSILALGKTHNISPSQVELEEVDSTLKSYEEQYGDQFQTILELNGYSNADQFRAILTLNAELNAVYADIEANPDRYIGEDLSVYNKENPTSVSTKHILIKIDEENGVDDKAAKKKANEVLKKLEKGTDFDELIEEYNDDTAQPEEGYTFGKGEMTEEFEKAAFALKANEISGLVKTEYGYHIIKRIVTTSDALSYAIENSKVLVNKSLLKDIEIKSDLKKLLENEKQQAEAAAAETETEENADENAEG